MKKNFIFDMDGVLLDTEPFYTEVTQQIVSKFGKTFDWSLKSNMIGRPALESAKFLVKSLDLPITPEWYLKERNHMLNELFPTAQPLEFAKEITKKAKDLGISMAVATSTARETFELKTKNHKEWFSIFNVIVTGDDPEIGKGKPAPDIFLLAAKRLNAKPSECVVFEDSPAGVQAAIKAKMQVIAIPDSNVSHNMFDGANYILKSLKEFKFDEMY